MLPKLRQMYVDAKQVHANLFEDSVHLYTETEKVSLGDQVDTVYSLKKTEDLLDDLRKELKKVRTRIETRACLAFYAEEVDSFATSYCSSKVKITQFPAFPAKRDKDPEAFDALLTAMGVPEHLIIAETVRPSFEGFKAWFTEQQATGQPLPEGLTADEVYTVYELSTRKKKDPDED